jgi:phosphate transport system substrate-binding protein
MALGSFDAICPECGKPVVAASAKRSAPIIQIVVAVIVIALVTGVFFRLALRQNVDVAAQPLSTALTPSARPRSTDIRIAMTLCGSSTMGAQLVPDLVRAFLSQEHSFASPPADAPADEAKQVISGAESGKPVSVEILTGGSTSAFNGLHTARCQIGMTSRRIRSSEAAILAPLGNMLAPASEHVIGLDGLAIIVNPANSLSGLTIDQLRDIFSGHLSDWKELGSDAGHIDVFGASVGSGTSDSFKALVLGENGYSPGLKSFLHGAELSSAVSADPRAIGFVALPYVNQAKVIAIASGASAVRPTALTVGRETYPLTRRLYFYTAASPQNPLVPRFVSFAQSTSGQEIVDRDGFVGTTASDTAVRGNSNSVPSNAPRAYRQLAAGYDQAQFNFYFNTGSPDLDNKALVDVQRLVRVLALQPNRGKSIVLAGFADSTGDVQSNLALSQNRALAARKELELEGIRVKYTVGFGQELPIRDNATEAGREKNRRVEIFLTR